MFRHVKTLFSATTAAALLTHAGHAAPALSLESYLSEVRSVHPGFKGALQASEADEARAEEGKLATTPAAFVQYRMVSDGKLQPNALLNYSSVFANSVSVGVSQTTRFGLSAKFHYDIFTQYLNNPSLLFPAPGLPISALTSMFTNLSPVLEVTQNLWSNGFANGGSDGLGRATKANEIQAEAQARAASYGNQFQLKMLLSQAEATYWRLAGSIQIVEVEKSALDRAQKILEWNKRRAALHLGDQSDLLQAQALVKSRELELASAEHEKQGAVRAFNSMRNRDSAELNEALTPLNPETVSALRPPEKKGLRWDVKAAMEQVRTVQAQSEIAEERLTPNIDLFASAALNGANFGDSLGFSRPTYIVGLQASIPLDFQLLKQAKSAWQKEKLAAELTLTRKTFEENQSWNDLLETFKETRNTFELAQSLESIQSTKLAHERERLTQGRTTTLQVLMFEQDFLQSQLLRIKTHTLVLSQMAQMKVYGSDL